MLLRGGEGRQEMPTLGVKQGLRKEKHELCCRQKQETAFCITQVLLPREGKGDSSPQCCTQTQPRCQNATSMSLRADNQEKEQRLVGIRSTLSKQESVYKGIVRAGAVPTGNQQQA